MKCTLWALLLAAVAAPDAIQGVIQNQSVKRVIDLTRHVVKVQTEIQFVDNDARVSEYQFVLSKSVASHLSYAQAKCGKSVCEVMPVAAAAKTKSQDHLQAYKVLLQTPVEKKEVGSLKLTTFFTRSLTPFPAEITQKEDQFVIYEDNHLFLSPYNTETQTTRVKLPSGKVESYSSVEPVTRKGSTITYGPYAAVESLSGTANTMRIHFKTNAPFLTVTNLVKEIEVSMWGRVAVEEVYDLEHTGAKLKGGFSRYDYTFEHAKGASFYEMQAHLPRDAVNVYYRDQIGNVSTSRLRQTDTESELELKPRFPLFGGWKTQFYLGYSVPTYSVLTRVGDRFKLEMDFSTSLEEAAVDDLTVKVILPEGSSKIQATVPFAIDSQSSTTRQTYLDTPMYGRPVVILSKKNLIAQHNVPFVVTFEFPQTFMLYEPLLLVAFFLGFFLFCMLLFRCDVSLSTKRSTKSKRE